MPKLSGRQAAYLLEHGKKILGGLNQAAKNPKLRAIAGGAAIGSVAVPAMAHLQYEDNRYAHNHARHIGIQRGMPDIGPFETPHVKEKYRKAMKKNVVAGAVAGGVLGAWKGSGAVGELAGSLLKTKFFHGRRPTFF